MKHHVFIHILGFPAVLFLTSCESKQTDSAKQPAPAVFTPAETDSEGEITNADSISKNDSVANPEVSTATPEPVRERMPTVAELKKITPSQEAKRALSNDAMQIYRMKPEAFQEFMQSRIPYYRDKGQFKAENDRVRLEITGSEMRIITQKETKIYPLQ